MSQAVTTHPGPPSPAAPAATPVVLVQGVPEPGLYALTYRADAPLDARSARVGVSDALWGARRSLIGKPRRSRCPTRWATARCGGRS